MVVLVGVVWGHGAGLHVVIGFLRAGGPLTGVLSCGQGCQQVFDGWEDVVVVLP